MQKFAPLACALTLFLAACSAPQPTSPALPAPQDTPAPQTDVAAEGVATEQETAAATAALEALSLNPAPVGAASVRPDGTLLVGEAPMFPMGFYHVSWAAERSVQVQKRLRDMHAVADLGFNTMNVTMFDPEADLQQFGQLLDAAHGRGMKLFVEDFGDVSINTFKTHPATLGWMIADDCNARITPEELERRHLATKALDPHHLTYTSMAISYSNSHPEFFGRADAVGNQSYPVGPAGYGDSLTVVYPVMQRLVAESARTGTLPIANLQSFRWPGGRYPTATELNSMTNQALGAGVKGILYYTYLDNANDLATYTGLRTELKKLAAEIKLLAPVLLNGQRQTLALTGNLGEARATLWTHGGRRYLQVLSLNETQRQSVKVTVPGGATTLTPLFAGRAKSLTLKAGAVTGSLTPLTAQWYEVR
ncbi:hypothetical protein [Deinococcus sp. NW-56]|uniref:hypothetical protein n=1 Tax=Deinococcus sp. NW-56 TaxID=2080419 RepID=UPI000CF374BC|nr:hypothetical protein [Deinococcus sp. NW-56]